MNQSEIFFYGCSGSCLPFPPTPSQLKWIFYGPLFLSNEVFPLFYYFYKLQKSSFSQRVMNIVVGKPAQQYSSSNYLIFCSTFHFKWYEYSNFIYSITDIYLYNFITFLRQFNEAHQGQGDESWGKRFKPPQVAG